MFCLRFTISKYFKIYEPSARQTLENNTLKQIQEAITEATLINILLLLVNYSNTTARSNQLAILEVSFFCAYILKIDAIESLKIKWDVKRKIQVNPIFHATIMNRLTLASFTTTS